MKLKKKNRTPAVSTAQETTKEKVTVLKNWRYPWEPKNHEGQEVRW